MRDKEGSGQSGAIYWDEKTAGEDQFRGGAGIQSSSVAIEHL